MQIGRQTDFGNALIITRNVAVPLSEIEIHPIRSQGSGGQNVNKVETAIHLRFDIHATTLPDVYKRRLLALNDNRITKQGVVIIKAQQFRSQDKNRQIALLRLQQLIQSIVRAPKQRKPTRIPAYSKRIRMEQKRKQSARKSTRVKLKLDNN